MTDITIKENAAPEITIEEKPEKEILISSSGTVSTRKRFVLKTSITKTLTTNF